MWRHTYSQTTRATPAQLWDRYAEPSSWPQWDTGVTSVTIDGPLRVGARGSLKPVRGPATRFIVTEVTPHVSFSDVSRLPLASMTFEHRIEALAAGCRFTHTVTISGVLAPLFARLIGRTVVAELPVTMWALARLAEQAPSHPAVTVDSVKRD